MALTALSMYQPIAKSQWQMTAFILMPTVLWADKDNLTSCYRSTCVGMVLLHACLIHFW